MSDSGSNSVSQRLLEQLCLLPGIGRRSAQRILFHLLKRPADEVVKLASAIADLAERVQVCGVCGNISEQDPCPICSDSARDRSVIMVVEQPLDIQLMEDTGQYRGLYHVLMGRLAPLDQIGVSELNIDSLVGRLGASDGGSRPSVAEVILALQPSMEGDGTALFLAREIEKAGVRVTRLARGLPTGASLDMVSKAVLMDALGERRAFESEPR